MAFPNKTRIIFLVVLTSLLTSHSSLLNAQCPLTVDAGPDQTACAPNGTVTLQGSVTGTALGFNWSPATGLSDPTSLTPTANVTGPQTYTLTASAFDPLAPNLVNNPAFENGVTGYTTTLIEDPLPITPGTYTLTTSPSIVISTFPPCDDHTFMNGTGFMMLINGPAVAGTQVWCQNIPVTPNTWYSMSAWATASPISPPELQFSVNGQLIGTPFQVQTNPCNWQQFSGAWFSGPAVTAEFCIIDQNGSGNGLLGDDFALDDIFFGEACSVSDDVMVSLVDVMAVLDPTVELPCNALPGGMMLDGTGSSFGLNITYQWTTTNGNIVNGINTATPTVDQPGTYTLTVTYNDGIAVCSDQASIQVLPDPNVVFAFIAPPDELNCDNPTVTINAGASSSGPTITYSWSPAANILFGNGTLFPEVGTGGSYTLTITNSISGCTAEETVFVFENFTEPDINVEEPDELTCEDTIVTLSGAGSSAGSEYTYQWTTTSGNILSGSTTLDDCEVDSAGVYTLTVTNTQNGCTADTFAIVMADIDLPDAAASAPNSIGCGGGSVSLSGTGSSTGSAFDYLWTTDDGNIVNGETTLDPTVDASAEYLLTVTNTDNGCSASDTTFLNEITANLTADIALPDLLTCVLLSQNLDATGSTQNPDITISWTYTPPSGGAGGGLPDTTLTPEISNPGTYTLTLTDDPTGCTETASVIVDENVALPTADAGPAATIDCTADPVPLDGTGSSTGSNFDFEWTTTGGNFAAGQTTLTPDVDAAGMYFLTITDLTNGCTAVDSTEVSQVGDAPVVELVLGDTLDCENAILTIDGSGSSSGAQIQIEWSFTPPPGGGGGGIAAGENTLSPDVDGAGTYTLTLTDQSTGCVGSGSIEVAIDTVPPVADIAPAMGINCLMAADTLDATASSQMGFFAYAWETFNGGQILSGSNTLEPVAGSGGMYVLTVVSWENGCAASDTLILTEDTTPPVAVAGAPQTLTCDLTSLDLDGNGSSTGGQIEYLWTTTDGNILNGETTLDPTIDQPGTYLLTVENMANGCTATDSVAIAESADLPTAIIAAADSLTCAVDELTLDGTGSSQGTNFTYSWTYTPPSGGGGGGLPDSTLMPTIDAPGNYLLTVTDTTNGCSGTESVEVFQNGGLPTVEAGQAFTLSCLVSEEMLDGTNSSVGMQYLWTTTGGNILSGETTLSPTINAPGTYTLTVTDPTNGCTASDDVVIGQDSNAPVADAGLPDTLTCLVGTLSLDGTGSSQGADIVFEWTTTSGNFAGGQNTLTPTVDAPGTYLLTLTDQSNDCESIASVTIAEVTEGPVIMVADTATLTCVDTIFTINATVDGQPDLLWTYTPPVGGAGGGILSGENTPSPTIGAGGVYLLMATDGASGCTSTASVGVGEDVAPPTAVIAPSGNIDCLNDEVILDGTGSSGGVGFDFEWTTTGGSFAGGQTTLSPSANSAGDYFLTVTNDGNGCTATAWVTVTVDTLSPDAFATAPTQIGCGGGGVSLSGAGSSLGPQFEDLWTTVGGNILNGETTLSPEVDVATVYFLTVTNTENGCTAQASAEVTEDADVPSAIIAQPGNLDCLTDLVTLDGTGSSQGTNFTYSWTYTPPSGGAGGALPDTTLSPDVDEPGTYILIIENTMNGCADTAVVSVAEVIDPPGADAGADALLTCDEPEIALDGGSPTLDVEYEWTTPDGNFLFGTNGTMPGVDASGTYFLTVTNPANGCVSVDSVTVTDVFLDDFLFENTDASCVTGEGSITFGEVTGGLGWVENSIDGGVTFSNQMVYENLPPGMYDLAVQDSGGCLLAQSVAIEIPVGVEVSLPQNLELTLGENFQLGPSLNVPDSEIAAAVWSPTEGLSCADCLDPVVSLSENGTYSLTVTDINGCTATATVSFVLAAPNDVVFVPNVFSPNGDGFNDSFVIFANADVVERVHRFHVFTRWGESVFENFNFPPNEFSHGWDGTHRGQEVNPGVFAWFAEVVLTNGEVRFFEGEVSVLK